MSYTAEWIPIPIVLGAVLLPLIVGPFAVLVFLVVAIAALAALAALAAAALATPYLLVRHLRRHHAEHRGSTKEGPAPVARVMAQPWSAT
jgi:hypothetical protein